MRWRDFGKNLTAAVLVAAGVIVLTGRRMLVPRVRTTSSPVDCLALILLLAIGGGHISPLFYYPYRVNLGARQRSGHDDDCRSLQDTRIRA